MKIKINEENRSAIHATLDIVNGGATAHTFIGATPIIQAAAKAEAKLELLGLNKSHREGAFATLISGDAIPKSYKYQRITSLVQITRGNKDWFMTFATASEDWNFSAGCMQISLTAAQDEIVTKAFRSSYKLQASAVKEVA